MITRKAKQDDVASYHDKADGVLRICANGKSRYLTWWERVMLFFGVYP